MKIQSIETIENLLEMARAEAGASMEKWWYFAAFTDRLMLDRWNGTEGLSNALTEKTSRLLELRVFSRKAEYRAVRGDVGRELKCSRREDDDQSYFDETQYLDIDLKCAKRTDTGWMVRMTGGGAYSVPLEEISEAAIVIRNYLSYYDKSGQAYVSDWRIVELKEGVKHGSK